jgi:hypothetical protein
MDSIFEVRDQHEHWLAWDLNFGRGTGHRRVFVVQGGSPFGKSLTKGRYDVIWDDAKLVYLYPAGQA